MLKHPFKDYCYNVDDLFGADKLSTFMNKLRKQSYLYPDDIDPDSYFGDGFEALIESLIWQQGRTKKIMIKNYVPVLQDDMGVDGYGYTIDGEIATVQCKARSNSEKSLTANTDHISNFVAHSHSKFGGDSKVKHMVLFTTAKDLHRDVANDMYSGEVTVLGNQEIRILIDNNPMFWETFRDQLICK